MPENHKRFISPEVDLDIGENTKIFINSLIQNQPSIKKYKLYNRISKLLKSFGKDRVETACNKLSISDINSLESMLKSGFDRKTEEQGLISVDHENIRGEEYYSIH